MSGVEPLAEIGAEGERRRAARSLSSAGRELDRRCGPRRRAERLRVQTLAAAVEAVELGVDRGGREALRVGDQHGRERRQARPARRARPCPGRARGRGRSGRARRSRGRRRGAAAPRGRAGARRAGWRCRRVAAASALPPPSPAGDGHALLDRDGERRELAARARAELGKRAGGEVVARQRPRTRRCPRPTPSARRPPRRRGRSRRTASRPGACRRRAGGRRAGRGSAWRRRARAALG